MKLESILILGQCRSQIGVRCDVLSVTHHAEHVAWMDLVQATASVVRMDTTYQ